jgi:serine protease Do
MTGMARGWWFAPALCAAALLIARHEAIADEDAGPSPNQRMAIYAKPSVVRVVAVWEGVYRFMTRELKEYAGGHGSGFFVSGDGYIATNAHVVRTIQEGKDAAKRELGQQVMRTIERVYGNELRRLTREEYDRVMASLVVVRVEPRAEVVLPDGTKLKYEIKAFGAPVGEGKDVAIIKVDTKNAPNLVIGDSDRMQVQDTVIAIGYPGAADLEGLFDNKSQLEASITDGTVSAIKHTTDNEPVLQVTTPITHGNSGGPAINIKGEVIGLTTFGNRDKVQGFNFLVASSTVKKFVKEARADNTPSDTHKLWRKALDEMWDGDYDQSITDFEEVMALFPAHSEAPNYVKTARALKKEGKGKKSSDKDGSSAAGVVVAILILGGLAGGLIFYLRKRARVGPGMAQAMQGHPPMHPHASQPMQPMQPPMMMGGRVNAAPVPVARTVAINNAGAGHPPVAATAFGSFTVGSLTCTRGLLNGQRFSLTATGLLIGRQPGQAQVVVNDSRASGKHVWIGYENGVLVAIDQGTTNGTFVNDVRLGRISKAPLKDGDTVIVSEPDCLSLQLKLS